jgi:hypothetical protein
MTDRWTDPDYHVRVLLFAPHFIRRAAAASIHILQFITFDIVASSIRTLTLYF